jgi:hypothetical protein
VTLIARHFDLYFFRKAQVSIKRRRIRAPELVQIERI